MNFDKLETNPNSETQNTARDLENNIKVLNKYKEKD
jgi:hypothetical protein